MAFDREKILQTAQKHVDKKKFDRAIVEYQRIVQHDPNDARTLLKVGDLQSRLGQYAEAIATYDRVGQYYSKQGFALKAIAVYKQIRELVQKHVPHLADQYGYILPKLAEIYTQLGLTSDALAAYDEVATRFQRGGRDREAIDVFRKMVELDETNPLPHLRLAEACCRVQSVDDAISSFWTAAQLLIELKRRDDALKVIERILHFRAESQYAIIAAKLYLERGTREDGLQGLAKLQIAFQQDPKNLEVLGLLAQAFTVIGQEAKSVEVYKEMARLAREQGEEDLFHELLAHLNHVAPNDEAVQALNRLVQPEPAPEPEPAPAARPHYASAPEVSYEPVSSGDPYRPSQPSAMEVDDDEVELDDDLLEYEDVEPISMGEPSVRPQMSSGPDIVMVDEGVEAVEELVGPDSFDAGAHARKAVVDAESFRKLRLYPKAIETLRIALEIDPRSTEIREALRDVLWESGDQEGAVGEMITLAAIFMDAGDFAGADLQLRSVLQVVPEHPTACEMLEQVAQTGFESPYDQPDYEPQEAQEQYYEARPEQPTLNSELDGELLEVDDFAPPSVDNNYYSQQEYPEAAAADAYPNQPLPSYDLEEVSAASALASQPPASQGQEALSAQAPAASQTSESGSFDAVDDPFGDAPLPSFPLGNESADDLMAGLDSVEEHSGSYPQPPVMGLDELEPAAEEAPELYADLDAEAADLGMGAPAAEPASGAGFSLDEPGQLQAPPAGQGGHSEVVEEVLEEAEFFAARGLYDDARLLIEDQLTSTPNNPLLLERLRELQQMAASSESGTRDRSELGEGPASESPEDRAFDIAASLDALDELDAPAAPASSGFASNAEEVDVDQVFAKFKQGVASQVSESDSSTHYDLGVAYKEMGLLSDAVHEFDLAARDPLRECMCYAMIGMIHLESGELDKAADAYIRGLSAEKKSVEQEMSLYYDLGNVYEMKNSAAEALYYFEKIARRDPGYRDVQERIDALRPSAPPEPASGARAVNDEDEFDRVFDDLFESK